MKNLKFKTDEHVNEHMGLLVSWADKYTKKGLGDFDDMLQDAMMVYMSACDSFDDTLGVEFSTYLYTSLEHEMYDKFKQRSKEGKLHMMSLDEELADGTTYLDMVESNYVHVEGYPIIQMRYAGFSMTKISEMMGISRTWLYQLFEEEKENFIKNS